MPKRYKATCPDGTVLTRKTKDRTYTHVLAVKDAKGWGQFGWIGRPDLIEAKRREAERRGYSREEMMVLDAIGF
jgi:hypothetical protein